MIDTRLALALEGGGLVLPEAGKVAVLKPSGDALLSALPADRIDIIEDFKPLHDQWVGRGFDCHIQPDQEYAAVIVCLPRAKAEARAMVAKAMTMTVGPVLVDGQKTDGVDSILKAMRNRVPVSAPLSKAHGKLFSCAKSHPETFQDWLTGPELTSGGFWTAPGVFSADGVDPASALLAETLPDQLGCQVADLGAGWGYLAAHVLTRPEVETLHLVEADHMALECSRRNVMDPRAQFHWVDAIEWQAPGVMDCVVMNPPFHTSRAADPALGQAFVAAAARVLAPKGQLWMVANRHLPYEQALRGSFANVFDVGGDARFKLFHATRPKRATRR